MVSALFVYQWVLVALVWLGLLLQGAWPSDSAAVGPTAPAPPFGGRFFIHPCIPRCSDETQPPAPPQGVPAKAPASTAAAWAALLW
jgi:hypothetical protein